MHTTSPTVPTVDRDLTRRLRTAGEKVAEWTTERNRLIAEAHRDGASLRAIGDAAGISHVAVRKIVLNDRSLQWDRSPITFGENRWRYCLNSGVVHAGHQVVVVAADGSIVKVLDVNHSDTHDRTVSPTAHFDDRDDLSIAELEV